MDFNNVVAHFWEGVGRSHGLRGVVVASMTGGLLAAAFRNQVDGEALATVSAALASLVVREGSLLGLESDGYLTVPYEGHRVVMAWDDRVLVTAAQERGHSSEELVHQVEKLLASFQAMDETPSGA